LELSNLWGKSWQFIEKQFNEKLDAEISRKYKNLNNKLNEFKQINLQTPKKEVTFFLKVANTAGSKCVGVCYN
jgi:hypothetical protein